VIDYGVLWVARAQAQNAADAGALAGATALAFDSIVDATVAQQSALATVTPNKVWLEELQPPFVTALATNDPTCVVPNTPPSSGNVYNCVTVRVYRNGQFGSSRLPTFFAKLVNVPDQGVEAEAKGTGAPANNTACVWPLAIPDKWIVNAIGTPNHPTPLSQLAWAATPPGGKFLKYAEFPALAIPSNSYTAPSFSSGGTGFIMLQTRLNTNSQMLTLTRLDPGQFADSTPYTGIITRNHFVSVVVPRGDGGEFASSLTSCNGLPAYIGDTLPTDNTVGLGVQAATAAAARRAQDPGATWNLSKSRIQNSCAASNPPCAMMSPRLVALPLFDVDLFETTRRDPGGPVIKIVNFIGFFIDQVPTSDSISGYLATYPGSIDTTRPQVQYLSAFLRASVLFR
jgi:hypothetical protein